MFWFRTLGSLELRSEEGHEVAGLVSSQKLVALLAYLAVATPRGLHRRDSIVALLWPELNQERARAALRHSAYRLRGFLGAGAIVNRGDEDIGVNPAILSCDAVRFEEMLDSGRTADALLLYEGDLLAGFFVRGAPEYERWLDGERSRLRKRASSAAFQLAETMVREGKRDEAAQLGRRAFAISPDDEALLRRLMSLLAGVGDTSGAQKEYDTFAKRLADDFDARPAVETRALSEKLKAGPVTADAPAVSAAQPSPVAVEEIATPAEKPTAESLQGLRPRWKRKIGFVGLGVLAAAIAAYGFSKAGADGPAADPVIAVLPFDVRGSPDLGYLREGMTDLLSIDVDGAAGLHSADPRAVLSLADAESAGGRQIDGDDAKRIARKVGAQLYITGSVVEAGGKITLSASLHDRTGRVRSIARTRTAARENLFDLVDELARQLMAGADGSPALGGLAARTTGSIPALRSFLEGERELRAGRHAAALDAFRQATTEDSTFALAWYRLSSAGRWTTEYKLAEDAAERAVRFDAALPPYARRLLEAATAMRDGAYPKSESLYVAATRSRPGDAEAWFGLGDLYYHYNALRGRSKGEARTSFERALRIDPGDGESRIHLLELAAWEGNVREVDSLRARLPKGSDFEAKWPLIHALMTGDRAREDAATRAFAGATDREVVRMVIHSTSAFPSNLPGATRVVGLLTDHSRSPSWRAYGHHLRAQIELARGRWSAARGDLTAMAGGEPAAATEYGALLTLSPLTPVTTRDLTALRTALVGWNADPTPASTNAVFGVHNGRHGALRLYLIGLVSARLGDTVSASGFADSLTVLPGDSMARLVSSNLSRGIRARVARARGDPRTALLELGQPWLDPRTHRTHYSSILAQVGDRFLMAELLREAGRGAEAIEAYSAVGDYSTDGLIYMPVSHLRRGDIYMKAGNREKAAYHYSRVVDVLKDCDPAVRYLRNEAERKLARARS